MAMHYYTTDEAAQVLGLSRQTLYQWSTYGGGPRRLKPVKNMNTLLWPKDDVDKAAAERRQNGK